ncbi:hypothetical protein NEOLEDRAFT_331927 [Neolentinus lepideus HHB14362 ss-1]|uniref:Uncharacterized protein n=1 Tax=Neolentinus lepideus HHB14362 ss-1 TaxID=1314782 RepID=A0A165SU37_9AGAM|nr:hypothetical protein NEOLEDRAFT_331927 [Neolentinus lepideus HHB14362 ss-1]
MRRRPCTRHASVGTTTHFVLTCTCTRTMLRGVLDVIRVLSVAKSGLKRWSSCPSEFQYRVSNPGVARSPMLLEAEELYRI